jgi:hypothetical protein
MVGELIMLPVRVGVRATRLWFRAVEETVSITSRAGGRMIELLASGSSDGADAEVGGAASAVEKPTREREPDAAVRASTRPSQAPETVRDVRQLRQAEPATPPAAEPAHVSEEPTLVDEVAEPGAEEGAGAEVRIDPPWGGYERLNAKEVVSRLTDSDPAELAAVQLYETSHRRRQTILNAVERELRTRNGSGPHG